MLNKVIISGGGTGGHIFPAIAIANEIKARNPKADILFVGALGKMEMERVPAAGYRIVGLPIAGLQRKLTAKNLLLPFKIVNSLLKARKILKEFQPEVVIGVGGYASGPVLQVAQSLKIPTVIQEQNSYPGKTNRILGKKVKAVCTAYDIPDGVFHSETIVQTGNPVRAEIRNIELSGEDAFAVFPDLDLNKKTVLVIGGSLGARTLNEAVLHARETLGENGIQVLWQCGKYYFESLQAELAARKNYPILLRDFIQRMDAAYTVADVIVSRAGALSISELCLVGKPVILVPSPNVSEDHQTKNALALVKNHAAVLVEDKVAKEQVFEKVYEILKDGAFSELLSKNIRAMAKPNATADIVNVIEKVKMNEITSSIRIRKWQER